MKSIVILGGGYGGLTLVHELLEKKIPKDTRIVLIDRMAYQGLKTEYYALAAGTIPESHIRVAFPQDPRLDIIYGEITCIHLETKQVEISNHDPVPYDRLIIALGCVDKYHGVEGASEFSHSIQTLSSSRQAYIALNELKPYAQVSVVGGGLSGVEIASELRESRPDLNIRILDRGDSILSPFPERLRSYVRTWFLEHEVEMLGHCAISKLESGAIYNRDVELATDLTVWTAGIQPSPLVGALPVGKDPQGRVLLGEYHQIPEHPELFVIGDCASMPYSPSAQLAEVMARHVAEVLEAEWENRTPVLKPIKLKGVLGSLGKKCGFGLMGNKTTLIGKVPRVLKSGVLWMSKHHFG
ncbi:NAD(P)/FAD-dependent oxidoreductase [Paenibacillus sp. y28]|uniref:NAD(P)/FAD-dependent oxidoreductase n=1 Tax=Paenibacillus sp. y28 TaxID=3129110 RepID=UPI0030174BB2